MASSQYRRVILIAATLSLVLMNQQAIANHGFLFCRSQSSDAMEYSQTSKSVPSEFSSIASKDGAYLRLQGEYFIPSQRYSFVINKVGGKYLDIARAKTLCTELMKFCPLGHRYTGANQWSGGTRSAIAVVFEQPKDNFGKLYCPNWVDGNEKGMIYPPAASGQSPYSADIEIPKD